MSGSVLLSLLAVGCIPEFDSVDLACDEEDVPGAQHATAQGVAFMNRLTCLRRYVGVARARINPQIEEATQLHVKYLEANYIDTALQFSGAVSPFDEVPGVPWYRGRDVRDRIEEAGYPLDFSSQIWQVFWPISADQSPAQNVEALLHDPFVRDALLAPGWRGGSYVETVVGANGYPYMYLSSLLYYPSGARASNPVTWPQDGQTDVPISWTPWLYSGEPFDKLPNEVGYPITFTHGSASVSGSLNPTQARLISAAITDSEGESVPFVSVGPGLVSTGNNSTTVALIPTAPLAPETTYTVDVELEWISHPGKEISLSFTTGTEPAETPFELVFEGK